MNIDEEYMRLALKEAIKGIGKVNPNPLVGAVIVKNGEVLSTGYHKKYGEAHAEVEAIKGLDMELLENATIYVTLEPCSHFGKTPPCTDLIIKSKIKRCVIGCLDPNPLVAGRGIEILKKAGIEVEVGVLERECKEINSVFFKYITTKIPYIFLKCGITLDGKIATQNYSSKWITNEQARERVQYYRDRFSAILVGANTVKKDNPTLRTKLVRGRDPYRIVLDKNLSIDVDCSIILGNDDRKTLIVTDRENEDTLKYKEILEFGVKFILMDMDYEMEAILKKIGEFGIDSILVEGGSEILSQFFKTNLYDGGEIFIAPKIIGDDRAIPFVRGFNPLDIGSAITLKNIHINCYGDNVGVLFFKEEERCLQV